VKGTISVSTSQQLRERVDHLAVKVGCGPDDILRDALLRFVAAEEVRLGIAAPEGKETETGQTKRSEDG